MKHTGKQFVINPVLKLLAIICVVITVVAGCATLPKDNAQLTEMKFDGLMG